MSLKIKPVETDRELIEKNLLLLASNETALAGLVEYVAVLLADAEDAFTRAARQAVFDDSARLEAAQRYGVITGITTLHNRLLRLQSTGR